MIIDGKQIAREVEAVVKNAILTFSRPPTLAIVVVGNNPVVESFVRIKKLSALRVGVTITEERYPESLSGEELSQRIAVLASNIQINGIIVQLPLPPHIDTNAMLNGVPVEKDVDMLALASVALFREGKSLVLPPVAGAIQEILERNKVAVAGKEVLILGHGRLVGVPAHILLAHNGAHVTVVDKEIADLNVHARESDLVISGVGKPGLISPDMLKPGVVLIDAGTSESAGKIVGDAHPSCAEVASVFTPVPGGVGPIAVAMIFKNLAILSRATLSGEARS